MAERIDFVNHKTGDWSFYYHYDDATAVQPVYGDNGVPTLPGYPITVPSRNQLFMMSNTKTIGSTTVNVARISFFRNAIHTAHPAASSSISSLLKVRLQYRSGQRWPDQHWTTRIPIVPADSVLQHFCGRHQLVESLSARDELQGR